MLSFLPLDTTKLNLPVRNEPVAPNKEEKIASDDEEAPKDSESSSDKKKEAKEKFVAPISGKPSYLKNISNHMR